MNVKTHLKPLIRMSLILEQIYHQLSHKNPVSNTPSDQLWSSILKLERQISLANKFGYSAAITILKQRLTLLYTDLHYEASQRVAVLNPRTVYVSELTARTLYEELLALQDEFEVVTFNNEDLELSVHTECIELEEITLGPYEIILSLSELSKSVPFKVVAVDPNTPHANPHVTHPHVQSEKLCMGDGKLAIERALHTGRLQEFFLLIQQVLKTYNPDSAYIKLENWEGIHCQDCDSTIPLDEANYCDQCNEAFCNDCYQYCSQCEGYFCSSCCTCCAECENAFCQRCLKKCQECYSQLCATCLVDESTHACLFPEEEFYDEDEEVIEIPPADLIPETSPSTAKEEVPSKTSPELHPLSLGETLLSP